MVAGSQLLAAPDNLMDGAPEERSSSSRRKQRRRRRTVGGGKEKHKNKTQKVREEKKINAAKGAVVW